MSRTKEQVAGAHAATLGFSPDETEDRRTGEDRRNWSVSTFISASFKRRRRSGRRVEDRQHGYVDWYEPQLLFVVISILLLSFADAVLTLNLLKMGAVEVNSFMAYLIERDIQLFAWTKMTLTGLCLVVLAAHANFRWLRMFRVERTLHLILPAYVLLITYEIVLLNS